MAFNVTNNEEDGGVMLASPSLGGCGYRNPTAGSEHARLVGHVLNPVHGLDSRVGEALANGALTPEGKRLAIQPALDEAVRMLDAQSANLALLTEARQRQVAFLQDAGAPSDAAHDRELRQVFASLNERQREETIAEMQRGEADGLLSALMRSPIRASIPAYVAAMWQDRVAAKHGPKLAELESQQENEDRARGALAALRTITDRAARRFVQ